MPALRRLSRVNPGVLVGVAVVIAVLGPLVHPGLALTYDMVFVPDQPLVPAILGLDGVVPRAVPSDLVVALLSRLVGVGTTQRLILGGILLVGAWGAARLVAGWGRVPSAAAALFFVWNAYFFERLALGQWALLVGVAALPWAVRSADGVRRGAPARRTIVPVGIAALGAPAGAVLVLGVSVLVSAWGLRDRHQVARAARVAGLGVLLSLWWLVPSVLRDAPIPADVDGVAVFASRADTQLGTLGSLLTLGGVWNGESVPDGRASWAVVPVLLALLVSVAVGLVVLTRADWELAWPLVTAAAVGLVLALASVVPGLTSVTGWIVVHVPGGGLVRDAQKWIAPLVLLESVAFAAFVGRALNATALVPRRSGDGTALRRVPGTGRPLAALALALPVLALPGLVWGLSGRLTPTAYPEDYLRAREVVAADPGAGAVLALPWSSYRRPWWTETPMLGSIPRWMDRRVVAADTLVVGATTLPGEDPYALRVTPVVESGDSAGLAALGIRWVVVEKGAGGPPPRPELLDGATRVLEGPALDLFRLEPTGPALTFGPPRVPVLLGDGAAAVTLAAGATAALVTDGRRARRSRGERRHARSAR